MVLRCFHGCAYLQSSLCLSPVCSPPPAALQTRVVQPGDVLDAHGRALPHSYAPASCESDAHPDDAAEELRGCASIATSPVIYRDSLNHVLVNVSLAFGGGATESEEYTNTAMVLLQCA